MTEEREKTIPITLRIPILNEEQVEHLIKAEEELEKAGVTFDTGMVDSEPHDQREWKLDWSLKGAKVILKK